MYGHRHTVFLSDIHTQLPWFVVISTFLILDSYQPINILHTFSIYWVLPHSSNTRLLCLVPAYIVRLRACVFASLCLHKIPSVDQSILELIHPYFGFEDRLTSLLFLSSTSSTVIAQWVRWILIVFGWGKKILTNDLPALSMVDCPFGWFDWIFIAFAGLPNTCTLTHEMSFQSDVDSQHIMGWNGKTDGMEGYGGRKGGEWPGLVLWDRNITHDADKNIESKARK